MESVGDGPNCAFSSHISFLSDDFPDFCITNFAYSFEQSCTELWGAKLELNRPNILAASL